LGERIPLPFPFGWFCIASSQDVPPGALRTLHCFGQDLVLFRTAGGRAAVLDPHCCHLGAHLGVGGVVEDDCVRCPFHGWRFDAEGRCVAIPYAKRIPPAARIRAWPVDERHGLVFVWYHPRQAAPSWRLPEIPEWGSPEWTRPEQRSFRVRSHPQEMAENVVDPVHFQVVHGTPHRPAMRVEIEGHVFRAFQGLTFTTPRGEVLGGVEVCAHGAGLGVTRFRGVVETLLVITGVPIDDELHETTIRFSVKKLDGGDDATANVARAFIAEIERQYRQDIPIWVHKRYLERPVLCEEDGPIGTLRRFYRQFYVDAAPDPDAAGRSEPA
jgi:nitrite reductase/ring-hydroxylating ferredoxin subunit